MGRYVADPGGMLRVMASIETLPSGAFRAVVRNRGARLTRTFPTRVEAVAWASALDVRKLHGKPLTGARLPRSGQRITLSEFRETWTADRRVATRTAETQDGYWRNWVAPMWGETAIIDLSPAKLDAWVTLMRNDGASAHVIYGAVMHLSAILKGAVQADPPIIDTNPVSRMRPLPTRRERPKRVLDSWELDKLIAGSTGQFAALWLLAAETGMRWSEYAATPVWAVSLTRQTLTVMQVFDDRTGKLRDWPKDKDIRTVPLSDRVCELLAPLMAGKAGSALIFTADDGGPLDYQNVRHRVWDPLIASADFAEPRPTIHSLRHTALTSWLDAGLAEHVVANFAGHADVRTLRGYSHVTARAFDQARAIRNAR